jgi:hypothetical protein
MVALLLRCAQQVAFSLLLCAVTVYRVCVYVGVRMRQRAL